jgi:hypothetical protein
MTPRRIQVTVVVLPASVVPREEAARRFKTGLTIASAKLLPNVQRCFKCHMIGHIAARCTVLCSGKELCRRCGSDEHAMKDYTNEARCAMCCRHEGVNVRHVTGSLACVILRTETKCIGFRSRRRTSKRGKICV